MEQEGEHSEVNVVVVVVLVRVLFVAFMIGKRLLHSQLPMDVAVRVVAVVGPGVGGAMVTVIGPGVGGAVVMMLRVVVADVSQTVGHSVVDCMVAAVVSVIYCMVSSVFPVMEIAPTNGSMVVLSGLVAIAD